MADHRETLASALRDQIIQGVYAPGQKLSEQTLARDLDTSRNTLREAFRVLSEQGLVDHVPNRGVSVAAPATADVVDIYRARRTIEGGVLAGASPLHPGVDRMREAVERARSAADESDWAVVGTANMAFHAAIVLLADSARLQKVHGQLLAELRLAFLALGDAHGLHAPFLSRNARILELMVGDGPKAAADELERYLIDSERAVLGAYARLGRD
ncbi:GntR family transcriptional regulator [Agrococcus casei]|uniref:Transcriptional regulator, GntR family n=1 Tax=Agrococcus casei LMG 22410 TaxID=1255656 RepID=A0A1R4FR82_9MICO|nr:GntR family transcriptional regulator [Agrococcus casei]SJM58435.1 Transcriptional regulator, GntR family [Agrococcus casei LMG 22410]